MSQTFGTLLHLLAAPFMGLPFDISFKPQARAFSMFALRGSNEIFLNFRKAICYVLRS